MFVAPVDLRDGEEPISLAGEWDYWVLRVNPQYTQIGNLLVDSMKRLGRKRNADELAKKIAGMGVTISGDDAEVIRAVGNSDDPAYQAWLRELGTSDTGATDGI